MIFLTEPSRQPVSEQCISSLKASDMYTNMFYTVAMCMGTGKHVLGLHFSSLLGNYVIAHRLIELHLKPVKPLAPTTLMTLGRCIQDLGEIICCIKRIKKSLLSYISY